MGNVFSTDSGRIKLLYKKRSDEEVSVIVDNVYELQTSPNSFLKYTITKYSWNDQVNDYKIQEYYKRYLIKILSDCGFGIIDKGYTLHVYWNLAAYNIDKSKSSIINFDDYEIL